MCAQIRLIGQLSVLAGPAFLAGLENKLFERAVVYKKMHEVKDCLYPAKEVLSALFSYLYCK